MEQTSIAAARSNLSSLIREVEHGKKRILLTSHGRPKAALVSLEDVEALEDLTPDTNDDDSLFREIDELNRRILERRGGVPLPSSLDDLYAIREDSLAKY